VSDGSGGGLARHFRNSHAPATHPARASATVPSRSRWNHFLNRFAIAQHRLPRRLAADEKTGSRQKSRLRVADHSIQPHDLVRRIVEKFRLADLRTVSGQSSAHSPPRAPSPIEKLREQWSSGKMARKRRIVRANR